MNKNILTVLLPIASLWSFVASDASATNRIVNIAAGQLRVYAQSSTTSTASFIEMAHEPTVPDQGANPTWTNCPWNRAYISFADKELLAKALTAEANGKALVVSYEDGAPAVSVTPHPGITCKVVSLW